LPPGPHLNETGDFCRVALKAINLELADKEGIQTFERLEPGQILSLVFDGAIPASRSCNHPLKGLPILCFFH
jgi:hypothetical protein